MDLGSAECGDPIVHSGELKKRNQYNMAQLRTFVLFKDGRVHYYKDKIMYRGQIVLTPDTQIVVTT